MTKPTFYVGLTMAGAISAGAYSGGVFDFLMEALDEWSKRKKQLDGMAGTMRDVPSHDVIIPVITGASAGAITGALGVVALAECDDTQAPNAINVPQVGPVGVRLTRLYQAWVTKPKFVSADGGSALLGTQDLETKEERLQSLLDTTILSDIVDQTFTGLSQVCPPRDYLAKDLHLFVTHTNIRGVPYDIGFTAGMPEQPGYPMMCHADWRHFRVGGLGKADFTSSWASGDLGQSMDVTTLPNVTISQTTKTLTAPWDLFAESAVGSGAFPVGLRARKIMGATVDAYKSRPWALTRTNTTQATQVFTLPPSYPANFVGAANYVTLDGGTINNEPFELARWTLMANPPTRNERLADKADRATIMIDPFPEAPDFDQGTTLDTALLSVVKKLVPALLNQARFKPAELADALDETIYSRFLIAPRRKASPQSALEPYGIACGLLSGFGGFLKEEFRAHDYQLGRLNCYLFLKNSFGLPAGNPIIASGYEIPSDGSSSPIKRKNTDGSSDDYTMDGPPPGERYHQIIPLYGSAATMPVPPTWPYAKRKDVEDLVEHAKTRAGKIVDKLAAEGASVLIRGLAQIAWFLKGKGALEKFVRWTVVQQLILRDQLDDYSTKGALHEDRKVISVLAGPSYDYYTAERIAVECGLKADAVGTILAQYEKIVSSDGPRVDGKPSYGLKERARTGFRTWPIFKQIDEWGVSGAPSVAVVEKPSGAPGP